MTCLGAFFTSYKKGRSCIIDVPHIRQELFKKGATNTPFTSIKEKSTPPNETEQSSINKHAYMEKTFHPPHDLASIVLASILYLFGGRGRNEAAKYWNASHAVRGKNSKWNSMEFNQRKQSLINAVQFLQVHAKQHTSSEKLECDGILQSLPPAIKIFFETFIPLSVPKEVKHDQICSELVGFFYIFPPIMNKGSLTGCSPTFPILTYLQLLTLCAHLLDGSFCEKSPSIFNAIYCLELLTTLIRIYVHPYRGTLREKVKCTVIAILKHVSEKHQHVFGFIFDDFIESVEDVLLSRAVIVCDEKRYENARVVRTSHSLLNLPHSQLRYL